MSAIEPFAVMTSWQFNLFGMSICAIMFVLRNIVEYIIGLFGKDPTKWKLWTDVLLPILPVFVGPTLGFCLQSFPYPNELVSNSDRILFGMVAGLLSGLIYRVVKSVVYEKLVDVANKLNTPKREQSSKSSTQRPIIND
jgi:hypothetical protein